MSNIKIIDKKLSILDLQNIDPFEDNLYLFPISKFENMKPNELFEYIISLGSHSDIILDSDNKLQYISEYIKYPKFFYSVSITTCLLECILYMKNIPYKNNILSNDEIKYLIENNKPLFIKLIDFYDSIMFYMLLLVSTKNRNNQNEIKLKYPPNYISSIDIEINSCSLLLHPDFYDYYYKKGVDDKNKFYYPIFEKMIAKNLFFNQLLFNPNNLFIKTFLDMKNPNFKQFLKEIN